MREVEQHVILVVRAVLRVRAVLQQVVPEVMADDARPLAHELRLIENSGKRHADHERQMAVIEQVMVVAAERVAEQARELHRVEPDLLDEPEDIVIAEHAPACVHGAAVQEVGPAEQARRTVICVVSASPAEVGVVVFFEARIEHERARRDERPHELHRLGGVLRRRR